MSADQLPHWDAGFVAMALPNVRPQWSGAAHLADRADRGGTTPVRARQVRAAKEASEASGLVSVPTSRTATQPLPESLLSSVSARVTALREELGAFALDKDARRLSMLRMAVGSAARLHGGLNPGHRALRAWMVTLTYRGTNAQWRSTHMSQAMQHLRMWCNRQGFRARYVWVAELQKRGVIHYHAVVWLPQGVRCPAFDSRGWWPHGMTNRKCVRSSAVGYLMKYLSKGTDVSSGSFPKGARIYGVAGLDEAGRRVRRWLRLPSFVQGNASVHDDWHRAVGGGWLAPDGARWASEFTTALVAGVRCLVRLCIHARQIDAAGPFSWVADRARALALPAPRLV